jgi:peroxiredoxin (alkyl hydroperoxide reductase subunit C)
MKENCVKMPLIGDVAPAFSASTTNGRINFPDDFSGHWVVFFSHPSDFTPVCTTEFVEFQRNITDFQHMNTKLLGLSVGALSSHLAWFDAIEKMPNGIKIDFALIDDLDMKVAQQYGMIQPNESDTSAIRAVFIIDPKSVIRTILYYPAILGRNLDEIKRIVMGLQVAQEFKVAIPVNWMPGDDVLNFAPTNTADMRKQNEQSTWFIKYKKLSQRDINEKLYKK